MTKQIVFDKFSVLQICCIAIILSCSLFSIPSTALALEKNDRPIYVQDVIGDGGAWKLNQTSSKSEKIPIGTMSTLEENDIISCDSGVEIQLGALGRKSLIINCYEKPYTVKLENFEQGSQNSEQIAAIFNKALKKFQDFVYPAGKRGVAKDAVTRGKYKTVYEAIKYYLPSFGEKVAFIGNKISMKSSILDELWKNYTVIVTDEETNETIFTTDNPNNLQNLPATFSEMSKDTSGKLHWFIKTQDGQIICESSFTIISKEEKSEHLKIISQLKELLPDENKAELSRYLTIGYLESVGLYYDSRQLRQQ